MKKIILPLLLILALTGCRKPTDESVVEGQIKGLGNDTIYIYSIDDSRQQIDTIVVEKDKFSYSSLRDTLTTNVILFANGERFPLFINKQDQIEIKGDTGSLATLNVEGGNVNADYQRYLKAINTPDSLQRSIQEKTEDFIRANTTSPVSVYLISEHFVRVEKPDITKIRELIKILSGPLQDDQRIRNINEKLEQEEKIQNNRNVPFFTLKNAKGETVTRNEKFKEQYLIINFWTSWSDSSRVVNSELRKLNKKYAKNKKVGLLGVNLDTDKATWINTVKQDTLTWEQAADQSGFNASIAKSYAISTLPTIVLVSPTGRQLARNVSVDSIATLLEAQLKKDADEDKRIKELKRK